MGREWLRGRLARVSGGLEGAQREHRGRRSSNWRARSTVGGSYPVSNSFSAVRSATSKTKVHDLGDLGWSLNDRFGDICRNPLRWIRVDHSRYSHTLRLCSYS